ncbi:MAG: rhomboid family intramembrane serine protease [Deltaproteobacteria bacterium]|nr:rhomboid family intramembrane serine protease [Deltaproteobacteria bacterium]
MFPLRDENPTFSTSFVTFLIIGLNVLAWVFIQGLGSHLPLAASVCSYGLIPGNLLGTVEPGTRVALGDGLACVLTGEGSYLSIVTSMFMHGGWFHIIGNMWFLSLFGDNVEDVMGKVRFALFYLLCGIAAAALQILTEPGSVLPMVGASGAISGVMGAYAVLFPKAPVHVLVFFGFFFTRIVVPAFLMLGYWFLIQLLGGIPALASAGGGVAFWAHVGGFLAGVVLAKLLCNPERSAACRARRGRTEQWMQRHRPD